MTDGTGRRKRIEGKGKRESGENCRLEQRLGIEMQT